MLRCWSRSLLRTYFTGDILVFRNTEAPLFLVERRGVEEILIETEQFEDTQERVQDAWCWKYRVREMIDPAGYDKVLFLDADCLVLRNIDHLLDGDWDIAYQPEKGNSLSMHKFSCFLTDADLEANRGREGVNSGTLAIRASRFHEVMAEWERIDSGETTQERFCSDQGSWNKLLVDTTLSTVAFPERDVLFPLYQHPLYQEYRKASIVHNLWG